MSDDKEPVDNHDFSDFDDLFAEQDDDFDPNAVLDAVSDDAPSTSDAKPIEDEDIDALIDDLMDDDPLDNSTSDDLAPDSTADENDPSDAAVDALLDQEWDDVVTPDEEPAVTVADEQEEGLPSDPPEAKSELEDETEAEPASVDAEAKPDAVDDDLVMDDDEIPDIDFVDDSSDEPTAAIDDATDDAVEELESFDDFIVDDDEPAITPEFGEQASLDPIPEPIEPAIAPPVAAPPVAASRAAEPDRADEWADDEIIPDRSSDSDRPAERKESGLKESDENDEEEDETVKQSNMIALIAGAVALVASMGGLWLGYSAKAELAQRPVLAAGGGSALDAAKLKTIDDKMGQVDERITKLSTRLASFGAMSGGSSDPKVDALDSRTARLEQLVSNVKEEIGHLRHAIASQPAKAAPVRKVVKKAHKKRVKAKPKPRQQRKAVAVAPHGGKWFVNLTSHSNPKSAQHQVQRMANRGIAAESRQVVVKGRTYYRVRVAGFASRSKSIAFKTMLAKKYKISDSWVSNH